MKRRRPSTSSQASSSGWFQHPSSARRQRQRSKGFSKMPSSPLLLLMLFTFTRVDSYTLQRLVSHGRTRTRTPPPDRRQRPSELLAVTEPSSKTTFYNSTDSPLLESQRRKFPHHAKNSDFFFSGSTGLQQHQQSQRPKERVNSSGVAISSSGVNGFYSKRTAETNETAQRHGDARINGSKEGHVDKYGTVVQMEKSAAKRFPSINGKSQATKSRNDIDDSSMKKGRDRQVDILSTRNDPSNTAGENEPPMDQDPSNPPRLVRLFSPFKRLASRMARDNSTSDMALTRNFTTNMMQSDDENKPSLRRLWRRRHARTLEEGIRRERTDELSVLMTKAQIDATQGQDRTYLERTLMGVFNVLAEEVEDLDIDVRTNRKTPIWRKEVEELRINFSRLGFRPLRMGGTNTASIVAKADEAAVAQDVLNDDSIADLSFVETADQGFDRIDEDNSGTLDIDELAQALSSISPIETDEDSIKSLASELLQLYDVNGDGVVDREEYQQMVEDMAKLRSTSNGNKNSDQKNPFSVVKQSIQSVSQEISKKAVEVATAARDSLRQDEMPELVDVTEMGSIVLSDLNLDLRRLVFGAIPVVKTVTPGGPLILEPFTATVTASFSREDVMGSFLLDAGLRRLVARALRVRLRSFRDITDGALFFGRRWKMFSKSAPVVEVLGLSNVEFDSRDKMIITGRARIRTSPDAPVVTNTFKVRTKIGTRREGHVIRLVEPELAFVFECPEAIDNGIQTVCKAFGISAPTRPEPLYSFFPIYSPFKVDDDAGGFDMGDDNCIRSIYIRDRKLRFEMSAVLRPGRFLGNHYIAFTLPMRTFIITMDRVLDGIRAARENKKVAARAKKLKQVAEAAVSSNLPPIAGSSPLIKSSSANVPISPQGRLIETIKKNKPKPKSFFTRFVEGYTMLESLGEAKNERLTTEISDWFGRQGGAANVTNAETDVPSSGSS